MGEYRRGQNPNSLANLQPWKPGDKPNLGGGKGLVIAPAMRKYASWSYVELAALAADKEKADNLPTADVIAIVALLKAAREVAWGDAARQFVTERLDGPLPKPDVLVQGNLVLIREYHGVDGSVALG